MASSSPETQSTAVAQAHQVLDALVLFSWARQQDQKLQDPSEANRTAGAAVDRALDLAVVWVDTREFNAKFGMVRPPTPIEQSAQLLVSVCAYLHQPTKSREDAYKELAEQLKARSECDAVRKELAIVLQGLPEHPVDFRPLRMQLE